MEFNFWKTISKESQALRPIKNKLDEELKKQLYEKWFIYRENGKTNYGKIYEVGFTFSVAADFVIIRYFDINDKKYNLKVIGNEIMKGKILLFNSKEEMLESLKNGTEL